jgi:hypothetical protein
MVVRGVSGGYVAAPYERRDKAFDFKILTA